MDLVILIYAFIFGTLIGSFLNVVVYRLPREESLSFPPSHCPTCNSKLQFYDLVPIFSYLFLRGKCRSCSEKISVRYPIVEGLTGLLFLYTVYTFGFTMEALGYALIIGLLVPIFFIDYDHSIIPDSLNLGIFIIALLMIVSQMFLREKGLSELLFHIFGLLAGGGFFFFIAVVTNGAMGGGDIKIMAALGFLFGLSHTLVLMFFSFVLGGVLSTILIILKIKKRKDYIPFGPFICLAAFITIFWGETIIHWYINFL